MIVVAFFIIQRVEGFGARWNYGARPDNVVSFYKHANFAEPRRDFPLGTVQNSLSKGTFLGLGLGLDKENDTYSSVKVPKGMKVLAYADNDLRGDVRVYEAGDHPSLGDFNDRISSFKVVSSTDTAALPVVIFYEHRDYKGKQLRIFGPGNVNDLTAIPGIDSRDKMFSSATIAPGYRVWAYKEQNLGGTGATFQGNRAYLGDGWNDVIRSFTVIKD